MNHKIIMLSIFMCLSLVDALTGLAQDIQQSEYDNATIAAGDSCMNNYDIVGALNRYSHADATDKRLIVKRRIAECFRRLGNRKKELTMLLSINTDSLGIEDMHNIFYAYKALDSTASMLLWGGRILEACPHDGDVICSMADHYNRDDKPELAEQLISKHASQGEHNLYIDCVLAYSYYLQLKYKKAIEAYKELVNNGVDNYETNFVLGVCYDQLDSANTAYPYLLKAVKQKDEKDFKSLYRLGKVALEVGMADSAKIFLEKAIRIIYPADDLMYYVYRYLGAANFSIHNYKEAGQAFAKCTELRPDDALSYYNAAQMYGACGNITAAKRFLQLFLEKAPHDATINSNLITEAKRQFDKMKGK